MPAAYWDTSAIITKGIARFLNSHILLSTKKLARYSIHFWGLLLMLVLSICLLILSFWSFPRDTQVISIREIEIPLNGDPSDDKADGVPATQPLLLDQRIMVIETPKKIWKGGEDEVSFSLEVDPAATRLSPADPLLRVEHIENNLAGLYNIVVESRLEMTGVFLPTFSTPMLEREDVEFNWIISSGQEVIRHGNLWVYLNIVPVNNLETRGNDLRIPILARKIQIPIITFLGMSVQTMRWFGSVGIFFVVGVLIFGSQRIK
jgi:hypothetical protein